MSVTRATPKRRRMSPADRREQLIAIGLEMLARRTLDELSVEEIAAAGGISRGLLFHYFDSKTDFHRAVVAAAAAQLIEVTEPDPSLPPAEQLTTSVAAFVDHITANRAGYLSLVRGAASGDAEMREVFDRTRARLAQRVVDNAAALGLALDVSTQLAVRGWIAFVEEVSVVWLSGHRDDVSREDLLGLVGDAFLRLIPLA